MKAVYYNHYGDSSVLETLEVPIPTPGKHQIAIRVMATAVNPIDWRIRSGQVPRVTSFPAGTGMEASGVVEAIGCEVEDVFIGDEVFGLSAGVSTVADVTLLRHWARKPQAMSWEEASAISLASESALRALRLSTVRAGDTLLIDGASGSVGSALIQFALLEGLRVVGTCGQANDAYLRSLGAIPVRYGEGLGERLEACGLTPDGIIDLSGRMIGQLLDIVDGQREKVVSLVPVGDREKYGVVATSASPTSGAFDALERAARLYEEGRWTIRIGYVGEFSQVALLQDMCESNRVDGKIVMMRKP